MGFNEFLAGINAKKPKEINLINGIITTTWRCLRGKHDLVKEKTTLLGVTHP
jgi:hypothetical protein